MELIRRLEEKDPSHSVYEASLPPADVTHPFYYIEELRGADDNLKREIMQDVYHTVSVWHDDPYKKQEVFRMLGLIGEVIREMEAEGTPSYRWMVVDSGMRVLNDTVSGKTGTRSGTVYVHGLYEVHLKQIGSR
ncbi:MAG: hypothetical protein E7238_00210 [Sarcina sp.]|nr:hypothetical protein [Sarcina sp.]